MSSATDPTQDVIIRVEGRVGRLTMNRPAALNALSYPMVGAITAALKAWAADPAVDIVILDGAGGRALCAGGDVLSMYNAKGDGTALARKFWRDEYQLNSMISRYPKPFVAIMDGIVMGGGIGLSGHASHRVVTEKSMLAMPETSIGLIPDVGGTWLLSQAPGELGTYLGLTGARMNAADAIETEFADYVIETGDLGMWLNPPSLPQDGKRVMTPFTQLSSADDVSAAFETFEMGTIPPGKLAASRREIDAAFRHDRVEDILAALEASGTEFSTRTLRELKSKSPKSLKLTLAALRYARQQTSLEACLDMEYRLVNRLYQDGEFIEGVRALLVDKDKAPQWNPPTLAAVTDDIVMRYLAPLPPGEELGLAASQT